MVLRILKGFGDCCPGRRFLKSENAFLIPFNGFGAVPGKTASF